MSANGYLTESQTRHQVFLLRRGAGLSNEIIPMVERLIEQVAARVASTPDQRVRQQIMLAELQSIMTAAYAQIDEVATQGLLELAEYEAGFQVRLYNTVSTVSFAAPAIEQLAAIIETDPLDIEPGRQITIRQALREYSAKKQRQITQTITDGIATQRTNAEIARDVQGLSKLHKRQADALVRTVASGVSSNTKERFAQENAEFLKGERYLAQLDSRVTQICAGLDSRLYAVGEGPHPPMHYNCRSVRVAQVRDDLALPGFEGERTSVGADGPEPVNARTTMNSWLRRQPEDFQREFFAKYPEGEEKYELFKRDRINAKDFVDASGSALTVAEIRAREGLVF